MTTLETSRLRLRMFKEEDFAAAHSYASVTENIVYMPFGPNSEEDTRAFIGVAIEKAQERPCTSYQRAIVLKATGEVIGGCGVDISDDTATLGWLLHRDHWKQGYGTEVGRALLGFAFDDLGMHRAVATCDAGNIGSYQLMEKIGMRREGLFIEARPAHKLSNKIHGDELLYAILKDEWDVQKEIAHYNALPCEFTGFIDLPLLSDGVIHLVCTEKKPAIPEKKYVPSYDFAICKGSAKIGSINLRIGYVDSLYYGGQIGYGIDEKHRGNGYVGRACELLWQVAKAHGMQTLLITNNHINTASVRVCEKLGTRFIRTARLPEWHDLYKQGQRFVNIYEWRRM